MNQLKQSAAIIIVLLTMAVVGTDLAAQDIHFSQFYASPLTLNPALTGRVNGNYRVAGIYRSQWGAIPDISGPTFGTPAGSFDMPFFVGKKKKDAVGLGVIVAHDFSNDKNYNVLRGMLSISYIKSLGSNGKHQLSIGVQGGIQQSKSGALTFEDQYVNAEFQNGSTSVDGNLADQSNIVPDFNAGLFYNGALSQKVTLFGGFSLFHLFEPKEQFGSGNTSVLPRRYVAHAGMEWDVAKKFSVYPGVIYMGQAKNTELNLGTNFGYHFKKTADRRTTLYFGGWYRMNDAFIAMTGLEFRNLRVGFSYDVRLPHGDKDFALTNANTRGAFEVSLIYVGNFLSISDNNVFLFCPRF